MHRMFIYISLIMAIVMTFIPVSHIDPDLVPYQEKFFNEVNIHCHGDKILSYNQVYISMGNLTEHEIGVCTYSKHVMKIIIDFDYWKKASPEERLSLYFHEGLHCYLGVPHNMVDKTDIMYPEMVDMTEQDIYKSLRENIKKVCHD